MLELIKAGAAIPGHISKDLKACRSLANIDARQPGECDNEAQTITLLENAEMNLLALADEKLGTDATEVWQRRINEASMAPSAAPAPPPTSRMGAGIPRGDHWIRIKSDYLNTIEGAGEMLAMVSVSVIDREDGSLLLHGKKEDVTAFLSKIKEEEKRKNSLLQI